MPDLGELLERFLNWLEPFYLSFGYLIVVLAALFEHTFFLAWALPGGILVAMGGLYAQNGTLNLPMVILFAVVGFVVGDHIDFAVGRRGASFLSRVGRGRRMDPGSIWTWRALPALIVAYTNTVPRAAVLMGGAASGLSYRRFLVISVSLALFWAAAFSVLGYWLGSNRDRLLRWLNTIGVGGWLVLLSVIAAYVAYRYVQRRRAAADPQIQE